MPSTPLARLYRLDHALLWTGMATAVLDGAGAAAVKFGALPSGGALDALLAASVTLLIGLFLRLVADPEMHRGLEAARRQRQGGELFKLAPVGLLDPDWGLFGDKTGPRSLAWVRAILLVAFLLALFSNGRTLGQPLQLAMTGFGITLLLSLIQLAKTCAPAGRTPLDED